MNGRGVALRALLRKELLVLFGAPMAYLTLALVGLVTALLFFDHLRLFNQILFVYTSNATGGFELGTLPERVNLQDQVFLPLMEQLTVTLIGLVPLVTMRVFAEERARGTDELLLTSRLSPAQIVAAKFLATGLFVALMLGVALVYPATSVLRAGLGWHHLAAVYVGLLAIGLALGAIGLACSAFSRNQLVAAISAYATAFALYDLGWLDPFVSDRVGRALDALSLHPRFAGFAEGVVSLGDLAYFAGVVAVSVALARLALDLSKVR
ncbi:MAG TPA: ABC transporter permease [Myxococcota bacterium]|jgi:ABC-2 type transport system permease protein|nr:ABC transporter permease [Myxococcota bacterium]